MQKQLSSMWKVYLFVMFCCSQDLTEAQRRGLRGRGSHHKRGNQWQSRSSREPLYSGQQQSDERDSVLVQIEVLIKSLTPNIKDSELDVDLFLSEQWSSGREGKEWEPHIMVESKQHSVLVMKHRQTDGRSIYSLKQFKVKCSCRIDWEVFPLDSTACSVVLISEKHSSEKVLLEWKEGGKEKMIQELPSIPGYTLISIQTSKGNDSDIYQSLRLILTIQPHIYPYMLRVYLPSLTFLLITFFAQFLGRKDVNSRFLLSGLMWLCLFFLWHFVLALYNPNTAVLTALDRWFVACLALVFLCLMSTVLITILGRLFKKQNTAKEDRSWSEYVAVCSDRLFRVFFLCCIVIVCVLHWMKIW